MNFKSHGNEKTTTTTKRRRICHIWPSAKVTGVQYLSLDLAKTPICFGDGLPWFSCTGRAPATAAAKVKLDVRAGAIPEDLFLFILI